VGWVLKGKVSEEILALVPRLRKGFLLFIPLLGVGLKKGFLGKFLHSQIPFFFKAFLFKASRLRVSNFLL